MSLISILVFLLVVGVVLYLLRTVMPIDGRIMNLIYAVLGIFILLWVLQGFGFIPHHVWFR